MKKDREWGRGRRSEHRYEPSLAEGPEEAWEEEETTSAQAEADLRAAMRLLERRALREGEGQAEGREVAGEGLEGRGPDGKERQARRGGWMDEEAVKRALEGTPRLREVLPEGFFLRKSLDLQIETPSAFEEARERLQVPARTVDGRKPSGFTRKGEIHINKASAEYTTSLHEAIHRYSHASFGRVLGNELKEGATEYFTLLVCRQQGLERTSIYPQQVKVVRLLVERVGEETLVRAYFEGDLLGLHKKFDAGRSGREAMDFIEWAALARTNDLKVMSNALQGAHGGRKSPPARHEAK